MGFLGDLKFRPGYKALRLRELDGAKKRLEKVQKTLDKLDPGNAVRHRVLVENLLKHINMCEDDLK